MLVGSFSETGYHHESMIGTMLLRRDSTVLLVDSSRPKASIVSDSKSSDAIIIDETMVFGLLRESKHGARAKQQIAEI